MKYEDVNGWEDRSFMENLVYLYSCKNGDDYDVIGDYYNGKADDRCWNVRLCVFDLSTFTKDDFDTALDALREDEAKETMDDYYNGYDIGGLIIAEEAFYECDYMGENIKENLTKEEADAFVKEYVRNN